MSNDIWIAVIGFMGGLLAAYVGWLAISDSRKHNDKLHNDANVEWKTRVTDHLNVLDNSVREIEEDQILQDSKINAMNVDLGKFALHLSMFQEVKETLKSINLVVIDSGKKQAEQGIMIENIQKQNRAH